MKKRILKVTAFVLAGAAVGYGYYHFFGCTTGCPITSDPVNTMAYFALLGGLLSGLFESKQTEK